MLHAATNTLSSSSDAMTFLRADWHPEPSNNLNAKSGSFRSLILMFLNNSRSMLFIDFPGL